MRDILRFTHCFELMKWEQVVDMANENISSMGSCGAVTPWISNLWSQGPSLGVVISFMWHVKLWMLLCMVRTWIGLFWEWRSLWGGTQAWESNSQNSPIWGPYQAVLTWCKELVDFCF
jgi:hypothetical protein